MNTTQHLCNLVMFPFALLAAIGMRHAWLVGVVGFFWHPFDLPKWLNGVVIAGIAFAMGLIGLMVAKGLSQVVMRVAELPAQEEPHSRAQGRAHATAGTALPLIAGENAAR